MTVKDLINLFDKDTNAYIVISKDNKGEDCYHKISEKKEIDKLINNYGKGKIKSIYPFINRDDMLIIYVEVEHD